MTMIKAKKILLEILNARENGIIKTDVELNEKIFSLLDNIEIYSALFTGDDPKSWYNPLSSFKKEKFDEALKLWRLRE
jgi:hypothetical protein